MLKGRIIFFLTAFRKNSSLPPPPVNNDRSLTANRMRTCYYSKQSKMAISFPDPLLLTTQWKDEEVRNIIICQAPRAGSMRQILCSDWLPERARWSDTACPGLPVSFPQIKFHQSSSECTKGFFPRNFFLLRWKDFLWFLCLCGTRKSVNENENKENKTVDEF